MNIKGSVVLVTGANRGLGEAFTKALLVAGAAKVYGGARHPESITVPGVVPVQLDVTSADDIATAAAALGDVTIVVNNAGISTGTSALDADAIEQGLREMATNTFGTLAVSQAFAPILAANGGGAIVNVLSVLSWFSMPSTAMYCASKAATWSITNSLRQDLHSQGTLVVGVHCGFLDTDMTAGIEAPKLAPETVVDLALDAVEHGRYEVLADELSTRVRGALSGEVTDLYPGLRSA